MIDETIFTIVGGDLRQAHLANLLVRDGYKVYGMFFDREVQLDPRVIRTGDIKLVLPQSNIVIFPLPITADGETVNTPFGNSKVPVEDCLEYISEQAVVFGGMVSATLQESARRRGLTIVDYFEREELAVLNAVPTAEGAVAIAIEEMPITLFGSRCLITGFGRVARVLAQRLTALGARVRVAARKYSDLAWIKIYGCEAVHISQLREASKDVDLVINTVPAKLLGREELSALPPECLLIDLASKPGGVDFETAKTLGVKTIWALSLPGKVAPITAGNIIRDTLFNVLSEMGRI